MKMGSIKPHEALKSVPINDLYANLEAENTKKSIDLSNEQISFIIQKCEYEIKDNKDFIENSKDKTEKNAWISENVFLMNLIKDIKQNFYDKCGTEQFVLQGLTPAQEEFVIEVGLERYREARDNEAERNEVRCDLMRKNEDNNVRFED